MFASNTSQVSSDVNYIEDFFSAWLRTGTGSSQTVTTGIKENTGALVISKSRSAATDWAWYDTFRGATKDLVSNLTDAETTQSQGLTSFNADGHTWGTLAKVNTSGETYVDYVLKPQAKFFDVVTYTGDGASSGKVINHNLGSIPGAVIIKRTDSTSDWWAQVRRSDGQYAYGLRLNSTAAQQGVYTPTSGQLSSTQFSNFIADDPLATNTNGGTYVAYLFAHDAGGFGTSGTDNVISCGSYTGNGSATGPSINLGYEPQWLLIKNASGAFNWMLLDNMRGLTVNGDNPRLWPNLSDAESTAAGFTYASPTATGFNVQSTSSFVNANGSTYIYIAIRRGPMKTPTSGTSVFSPNSSSGSAGTQITTNFPADALLAKYRSGIDPPRLVDRLRGLANTDADTNPQLTTDTTDAEAASNDFANTVWNTGFKLGGTLAGLSTIYYAFRRAPGFFDEVCYTGDATTPRTINHNLGVAPELIITKQRSAARSWPVRITALGDSVRAFLNLTDAAAASASAFPVATYTSSTYVIGSDASVNASGGTYVAYLFASCPGVSKVGSYTGTGTTLQIDCGFTGGARFVLIKRTDSTGDWYVWDSARGIVAGNDPYLLLNSTAAEVTSTDYVDTYSAGFEISSTAPAAINANGGTFVFLAIA